MSAASSHTLVLGGDASIKTAQDVAGQLRAALDAHGAIAVDTQTLSSADLTTVQTLLAARSKAQAEGKTMTLLAPLGAPLLQVLKSGGFLSTSADALPFWTDLSHDAQGLSA